MEIFSNQETTFPPRRKARVFRSVTYHFAHRKTRLCLFILRQSNRVLFGIPLQTSARDKTTWCALSRRNSAAVCVTLLRGAPVYFLRVTHMEPESDF